MSPLDTILDEPLGSRSHVVTLRGAIDVDAARELERRLRDLVLEGKRTIIADLTDAEELTPSLLGALMRAQRSLDWRNGRLLLVCDSEHMRERLAMVGLPNLFEIVDARRITRLRRFLASHSARRQSGSGCARDDRP